MPWEPFTRRDRHTCVKSRAFRNCALAMAMIVVAGCSSAAETRSAPSAGDAPSSAVLIETTATTLTPESMSSEVIPNSTEPRPGIPSPDLGTVTNGESLVAALLASGPADNETPTAVLAKRSPDVSICASTVASNEPTAGTLVHQASAVLDDSYGVVLVFQRTDGVTSSANVRHRRSRPSDRWMPVDAQCRDVNQHRNDCQSIGALRLVIGSCCRPRIRVAARWECFAIRQSRLRRS